MTTNDQTTFLGRSLNTTASRAELADARAAKGIDFAPGRKGPEEEVMSMHDGARIARVLIDPRPGNPLLESLLTAGCYLLAALAMALLAFSLFFG